jgi:hypothetical protein
MTESTIFDTPAAAPTTPEAPVATPPVVPVEDQLLKTIVNEQGIPKYKSVEDAIKALAASQEHIKRIELENAQFKESTIKAKTMDELLEALKPKVETAPAAPTTPSATPDLNAVVNKILAEREREQTETQNITIVTSKLKEVYGQEKASEVFYAKASALGFSQKAINELAAENPLAVFKLLDITPTAPTPSISGIRTEAFASRTEDATAKGGMALGNSESLLRAWRGAGEQVKKAHNIK